MEIRTTIDVKPGQERCPKCFSLDIAPGVPYLLRDRIMLRFHRMPRECRFCGCRFYLKGAVLPKARARAAAAR